MTGKLIPLLAGLHLLTTAWSLSIAQDRPALRVELGTESVNVGMPFDVQLTVTAPAGSTVLFPPSADSGATVRLLDPVAVSRGSGTAIGDGNAPYIARYRMAAWDIGAQPISFPPVVVQMPDDTISLPINGAVVNVLTVLPADTLQRQPKGARGLFSVSQPWWRVAAPLVLLLLSLAALLRWWYVRRARAHVPGYAQAFAMEMERVRRMPLVEAGEKGRAIALVADLLRQFLAVRIPHASTGKTSAEIKLAVAGQERDIADSIASLLDAADRVKFARDSAGADDVTRILDEAIRVVHVLGDRDALVPNASASAAESAA